VAEADRFPVAVLTWLLVTHDVRYSRGLWLDGGCCWAGCLEWSLRAESNCCGGIGRAGGGCGTSRRLAGHCLDMCPGSPQIQHTSSGLTVSCCPCGWPCDGLASIWGAIGANCCGLGGCPCLGAGSGGGLATGLGGLGRSAHSYCYSFFGYFHHRSFHSLQLPHKFVHRWRIMR